MRNKKSLLRSSALGFSAACAAVMLFSPVAVLAEQQPKQVILSSPYSPGDVTPSASDDGTAGSLAPEPSKWKRRKRANPKKQAGEQRIPTGPAPTDPRDMTIAIPQSELDFKNQPKAPSNPPEFEFNASTWSAQHLRETTYLAESSELSPTSVPQVSMNYITGGWHTATLRLAPLFGFTFSQMQRTGSLSYADQGNAVSQTVNFFSARAGLLVATNERYFGFLRPYGSFSILPTLETAPMTPLSNGISHEVSAVELAGGLSFAIPAVKKVLGFTDFSLELGFESTLGAFGSSFDGLGVLAGTRITL